MTMYIEDDPHDDCTHWIGKIPDKSDDSTECITERDTRRQSKSNVLSQELGLKKTW